MHDSHSSSSLTGNTTNISNITTTTTTNSNSSTSASTSNNSSKFICGVVEGFYGKPWTFCQRKDLFKRLKEFNLNSFMYAPKDDTKHRAKWRQLYSESEALELKSLIDEAAANGIDFYYSLAPGLDMIYSSQEEKDLLCQKFRQVHSLGCKSYAILFDDIEPNLTNENDRVIYNDNYASAQVAITNLIYNYLGKPKFLFCPTEYCESRAVPNVLTSNYLNTIGTGLNNAIDIMWSGPRVVSRYITEESIKQLNSVIRRPALIWENLHANDYDKKRVYLGPYSGRSTKLISQLRGVLTNPNCEYEANYIAIHTLAQWSKCTEDVSQDHQHPQTISITDHAEQSSDTIYDPNRALVRAIRDWIPHLLSTRSLPQGFDISTNDPRSDELAGDQLSKDEQKASSLQVGDHGDFKSVDVEEDMPDEGQASPVDKSPADSTTSKSDMDTSSSPSAPKYFDTNSCDSCEMQDASELHAQQQDQINVGCIACTTSAPLPTSTNDQSRASADQHPNLTHRVDINSLALLVDFFYLPFEHGIRGHAFLKDIKWLIDNSGIFAPAQNDDNEDSQQELGNDLQIKDDEITGDETTNAPTMCKGDSKLVELWTNRADKLSNFCACINRIIDTLVYDCPNKLIMVELYPYLVDLRDVVIMITDYIKFLRYRKSSLDRFYFSGGPKRREFAASDEHEPWVHRGGLIGDVQRLIS